MAGVTGNYQELRKLKLGLERIGRRDQAKQLSRRLGDEALSQLSDSFREERDPYGRPWKRIRSRLAVRGISPKILRDTGRLAGSFSVQAVSRYGFALATRTKYASTHQYGAIIRAKNAPYLVFKVPGPAVKLKNGKTQRHRWVRVKKVTIPKRQMVPERTLGRIWRQGFEDETRDFLLELLRPALP